MTNDRTLCGMTNGHAPCGMTNDQAPMTNKCPITNDQREWRRPVILSAAKDLSSLAQLT
jgi:hypothetical protein